MIRFSGTVHSMLRGKKTNRRLLLVLLAGLGLALRIAVSTPGFAQDTNPLDDDAPIAAPPKAVVTAPSKAAAFGEGLTRPQALQTIDLQLPLPATKPPVGNFSATIGGAHAGTISGVATFLTQAGGGVIKLEAAPHPGVKAVTDPGAVHPPSGTISILVPAKRAVGKHPLRSFFEGMDDNGLIASYAASFSAPVTSSTEPPALFTEVMAGEVTVDQLTPLSGSFIFTARSAADAEVKLRGTFTGVPVPPAE